MSFLCAILGATIHHLFTRHIYIFDAAPQLHGIGWHMQVSRKKVSQCVTPDGEDMVECRILSMMCPHYMVQGAGHRVNINHV